MKAVRLFPETRLFLLFVLSVIFPAAGYSDAYTNLLSWTGWGISSKAIQISGEISKLSFRGNNLPLHLTYDLNTVDQGSKTVPELENNQFYIIQDGQPGDLFNFCFRTPPALSASNLPSPPVITKPATGRGMSKIQDGGVKLVPLAHDSGRWQYQYSARWRIPTGSQSLLLAVEDNNNGWVIEPECSGIVSESAALPSSLGSKTSDNKKTSFVDIIFRNTETEKNEPDDDSSRSSGPLAIPGAPDTADYSEPFPSSGGGSFGGSDDLDDLFKKRPGGGRAPLYVFEWMSELFSRVILVPVPGTDGKTVKKQIWDTRIVLNIKQGWNEQAIIISQELWNKIRAAHLERSSGLFLALSRNPDNPEAVFDHYLSNNPPQSFQTEDYQGYEQQVLILNPKQLRSVSVFPGHCPTGVGCPGGSSQAEKQTADLRPSSHTRSQEEHGRLYQDRGGFGGRRGDGDDGSGGAPNNGLCIVCQNPAKPVIASNICRECLDPEFELSAFTNFQEVKRLEKKAWTYFDFSDHYNLPKLYELLTRSFLSNRDALHKFNTAWVKFLRGDVGLDDIISKVDVLAQRNEFESQMSFFENELKDCLKSNNIFPMDDPGEVLYSGLGHKKKVELINFIYYKFKHTSNLLKEEMVSSQYNIINMLNDFAKEIYDEYGFGFPFTIGEEFHIIPWGHPYSIKHAFITPSSREVLVDNPSYQTLQDLALAITGNKLSEADDVRAMFTAMALIGSMFEECGRTMFRKPAALSKELDDEQLDSFAKFTFKAREQLIEILNAGDPEQKDEFIRSMFLIFGMVPKQLADELSQEWDPRIVWGNKPGAHVARYIQQPKRGKRK
ncbi:hypothetical protein [Endozoicomonas sp. 4G]|uniref:hypothetical protein n=1 Tax=Endozoicomonas sp. 4G TaxID=2872754 RepID=UPI002078C120|nr:hypothetical protein [Endozoicomonas sp. 4G]